jgi:hypothetical protein
VFRTFSDTFLAADANGVYVAWQEKNPVSGSNIKISRSLDGGASWETPVMPRAAAHHQLFPFLTAAGGKLSVAWYDSRNGPSFTPDGPVSGQWPPGATSGAGCTGLEVYYNQTSTSNTAAPLSFGTELRVTNQSFNPNLYGSIKAFTPFIGDYIGVAANATDAYVVWTDNRDMNPTANAAEDDDATTDPAALINARSRDSNIYIQKIAK